MLNLKTIILIPYVASNESEVAPSAEAMHFYNDYFNDAEEVQILGESLEGRLFVKDNIGLYVIGEGKTNASMYCTALLADESLDFSNTKFILFGCCGAAFGVGVVGDIYLIGETVDYELGHHADSREEGASEEHSWYPNESFGRFGYIDLSSTFFNEAFDLIKDEHAESTKNAKDFMAKTFDNEDWATREPKIMKATSVTADSYWKGKYDHQNAKYVSEYYKCSLPFAASDMEDIAVAQVFRSFDRLRDLIIMRFAVNTDVFMDGQNAETLWGNGISSFTSSGFDSFDDAFPVVTKRATELAWKIINN